LAQGRDWNALLADDAGLRREVVRTAVHAVPEVEMTKALGAERGERTEVRLGDRVEYYAHDLITRVGRLELRLAARPHGALLDRAL